MSELDYERYPVFCHHIHSLTRQHEDSHCCKGTESSRLRLSRLGYPFHCSMGKDRCSQPVVADSLDISLYYFVGFRLRSDVFISVISSHIQYEC